MAVVLVVDDHRPVADAVAAMLERHGHEAATVHGGAPALAFVQARPVDLVILDVSMPGMSGLDVLRELRVQGMLPALPVIMFSADDAAREEALRLGAVGFVFKGDAEDLGDLVARHAAGHATT